MEGLVHQVRQVRDGWDRVAIEPEHTDAIEVVGEDGLVSSGKASLSKTAV